MAKDIETYIEELKLIAERLSKEDIKLKEAVELYKKGAELAVEAEKLLEKYENEIEVIAGGEA